MKERISELEEQLSTSQENNRELQKELASGYETLLQEEEGNWQDKVIDLDNLLSEKDQVINQQSNFLTALTNKKNKATQKIKELVQEQKNHKCPSPDNSKLERVKKDRDKWQSELTRLQQENQEKEQKIGELEQEIRELKNKPPVIQTSKNQTLLTEINQQKATIQQLQTQLQQAQEPQIIVKEIPKADLTVIQQLETKLRNKEQIITQFSLAWLLLLGINISTTTLSPTNILAFLFPLAVRKRAAVSAIIICPLSHST
ncbi:892_t:CDS:2 [Ambispora gerdemannii]|uniref:892_t:CDS:1 n=1 Tax=Ambispora gerdemannii TaxID=144530 RepID=A0A9N9BNG9_9GLOM|nr:892_t:CDS:2 [Ambispora gerdemannii]